jgi:hypothetical protein
MNTSKQFWALLRFQAVVSPFVWVLPLAFCTPLLFMSQTEPSLNMLMLTQNLFLVLLLGALILAPEIFTTASGSQAGGLGAEFIRTRAVDKSVLARSKAAFFYLVALIAPMAVVLYSLRRPDLHVMIYERLARLDCLSHVPGSALVIGRGGRSDVVSIPNGNVLIAAWRAWEFLALAIIVQVFVYAIYPFRYRRYYFWAFILLVSLSPMLSTYSRGGSVPWDQHLFFRYAAFQSGFWILALAALFLAQVWCERRFARLEE